MRRSRKQAGLRIGPRNARFVSTRSWGSSGDTIPNCLGELGEIRERTDGGSAGPRPVSGFRVVPVGHLGPPTISSGYWTNDSVFGTFDHHDAGLVEIRPGQGIASPSGAYEHGTAESRGGCGRG